jgi:hypothetical protein
MSFHPNPTVAKKIVTTESDEWKNSHYVHTEQIRARERRESVREIAELIAAAWKRIGPSVLKNRDELMARLARRRARMVGAPPRAWCAAVRASDTRINPVHAILHPKNAMEGKQDDPQSWLEHRVTLDAALVRMLCKPVWCDWPYNSVHEVMKKLGWTMDRLRYAMGTGVFEVRKIPHLDGKRGPPIPVLYTHRPLDPAAQKGQHADAIWGTTIRWVCDHIPENLAQTIRRVPAVQTTWSPRGKCKAERFMGWKWICPGCGETCRTIYLPLPPMALVGLLPGGEIHRRDAGNPDAISPGMQTFACGRCHGVLQPSRLDARAWNQLISHISGGLLYGHEVQKPDWWEPRRKRRFVSRINRAPSVRREQVRERLQRGISYREIAAELGISYSRAADYAREVFRQERVKNLKEFLRRIDLGELRAQIQVGMH